MRIDVGIPNRIFPLRAYSALVALYISVFVLITGNGLMSTLVPTRAKLEAFPDFAIGLGGAAYFGGMLLGTLADPWIIRRSGFIRAFGGFIAAALAATAAFPVLVNPWIWACLRGVHGFAFAGVYAVIDAWVNAKATNQNRGRLYGMYQAITFISSALGQQLLLVQSPHSFRLFSLINILFALAIIPMMATQADPPQAPASVKIQLGWLFSISPIGAITAFGVGAANGSFWTLAPVYVLGVGFNAHVVADFVTAVVIGSTLMVWPVGRLSDKYDRRKMIVGLALIGMMIEFGLCVAGRPTHLVMDLLGLGLGSATMVLYTLAISQTNDRAGPENALIVSAGLLFLYCVGATLAPVLASFLMQQFGPEMLFAQNGVTHFIMAAFAMWRMMIRPPAVNAPRPEITPKSAALAR